MKFSDWALLAGVIISCLLLIIASVLHVKNNCEEDSYYEVSEWSECMPGGVRTRVVTEHNNLSCKSSRKPPRPVDTEHCNYIRTCEEKDYIIEAWSTCAESMQTRGVRLKAEAECLEQVRPAKEKACDVENKILLLKDYTTEVNPSNEDNPYSPSYRNVTIIPFGEFKNVRLHVAANTSVLGGESIQIPEYYYFLFSLGEDTARALGTSRSNDNRLDLNDYGVFKGTQMPVEYTFDLSPAQLAKATSETSGGGIGSCGIGSCSIGGGSNGSWQIDYAVGLSENSNEALQLTLLLADGRSMIAPDPKDRIFGTISFAYLEYECVEGSECRIERLPPIKD